MDIEKLVENIQEYYQRNIELNQSNSEYKKLNEILNNQNNLLLTEN